MTREQFNKTIKDLIINMLKEDNITVSFQEDHMFGSDIFSLTLAYNDKGVESE